MALEFFLKLIIQDPALHARWLNTLSYLENCGARKIAACEHPLYVKEDMLKHAAEEFRHAYFFKRQIHKVHCTLTTYDISTLLGGFQTLHYLDRLEARLCRIDPSAAYLLTTYAIEKRAQAVYPAYQQLLADFHSPISIRSILKEEEQHLEEIEQALEIFPHAHSLQSKALAIEEAIYSDWIEAIKAKMCLAISVSIA